MSASNGDAGARVLEALVTLGVLSDDALLASDPRVRAELAVVATQVLVLQGSMLAELALATAGECDEEGEFTMAPCWRARVAGILKCGPLGSAARLAPDGPLAGDAGETPHWLH